VGRQPEYSYSFVCCVVVSLNRSVRTRVYAGKWTTMVYQLQMARFWSILGVRTNLIDGKCCPFNGEMDNVFGLWSKTHF
jgi:hypothetical protein